MLKIHKEIFMNWPVGIYLFATIITLIIGVILLWINTKVTVQKEQKHLEELEIKIEEFKKKEEKNDSSNMEQIKDFNPTRDV